MGTSLKTTESQLELAKAALARRVKALEEKKIERKKFKSDPHWRMLDAKVRQINSRIRKIAEVTAVNEAIIKHKEEDVLSV